MDQKIKDYIEASKSIKDEILASPELIGKISAAAKAIIESYKKGGKVLIAGNGGSAADAQHIAGELVSKFFFDRPGLPAMALTTDTSIITAIGNDYGFEKLFERQIQANANGHDVFIGITTSGKSKNILKALEYCREKKIFSVVLAGESACECGCDICINVPSKVTPYIQESHIMIGHIICMLVEEGMFKKC